MISVIRNQQFFLDNWRSNRSQVFDVVLLFFFFPEGEVFFQKFDDRFGISEGFLVNIVDFLKGFRERVFSEFDGLLLVAHHFVMEDGEIKGKTKSNRMARVQRLAGFVS